MTPADWQRVSDLTNRALELQQQDADLASDLSAKKENLESSRTRLAELEGEAATIRRGLESETQELDGLETIRAGVRKRLAAIQKETSYLLNGTSQPPPGPDLADSASRPEASRRGSTEVGETPSPTESSFLPGQAHASNVISSRPEVRRHSRPSVPVPPPATTRTAIEPFSNFRPPLIPTLQPSLPALQPSVNGYGGLTPVSEYGLRQSASSAATFTPVNGYTNFSAPSTAPIRYYTEEDEIMVAFPIVVRFSDVWVELACAGCDGNAQRSPRSGHPFFSGTRGMRCHFAVCSQVQDGSSKAWKILRDFNTEDVERMENKQQPRQPIEKKHVAMSKSRALTMAQGSSRTLQLRRSVRPLRDPISGLLPKERPV